MSMSSCKHERNPLAVKAKAAVAQVYAKRQKELVKEKLREIECQGVLQRKLFKAK